MKDNIFSKQKRKSSIGVKNLKGSLKLEQQVIMILSIISMGTLLLSIILEYIYPIFILQHVLTELHVQFTINVLLGISCSSVISLICILIPFLCNKKKQEDMLFILIKKLFFYYETLITSITQTIKVDKNDKTYLGEIVLYRQAIKLERTILDLKGKYEESDIILNEIESIVGNAHSVFLPIVGIIKNFIFFVIPQEYATDLEAIPLDKIKPDFMLEKNKELYDELFSSLEEFKPCEEIRAMFNDVININSATMEMFKESSQNLLNDIIGNKENEKTALMQMKLNYKMLTIVNNLNADKKNGK